MSTRVDILAAKAAFGEHVAEHGCQAAYLRQGNPVCELRIKLWLLYMETAAKWGIEPGDKAKVTEQYGRQTDLLGQHVTQAA